MWIYRDREDAGTILAEKLKPIINNLDNLHIAAIPNGGIPIGIPVATRYDLVLYVIIARKIQYPWTTEAGYGAVTSDGVEVYNSAAMARANLSAKQKAVQKKKTLKEIKERENFFKNFLLPSDLSQKTVILIDDGLASGITMMAAIRSVSNRGAEKIFVAVPTAHKKSVDKVENIKLRRKTKVEVIAPNIRSGWSFSVASAYKHWFDETKERTLQILEENRKNRQK
ncbi:MAG: hypothetical protein GF364_11270 [Candidatus Lokiarchaeota archaeon]|nr:hypothetical protein [Candidatus Lokiarchaeota archaeon]